MSSTARIGSPAVTRPRIGTEAVGLLLTRRMVRPSLSSLSINPRFFRVLRWECTVDVERSPVAEQISLTEGECPDWAHSVMYFNIFCWLCVKSFIASPPYVRLSVGCCVHVVADFCSKFVFDTIIITICEWIVKHLFWFFALLCLKRVSKLNYIGSLGDRVICSGEDFHI